MILAAADCAAGKGSPPPSLSLAWRCRNWHALPNSGGIRDQYVGELERMTAAENVYNVMKARSNARTWHKFVEANPDALKILQTVMQLRAERKQHGTEKHS